MTDVAVTDEPIKCQCGAWSGSACDATVAAEWAVVEWMPRDLRASHETAGNRGRYPHNGAERLLVTSACAEAMIEADGEWCEVVKQDDGGK